MLLRVTPPGGGALQDCAVRGGAIATEATGGGAELFDSCEGTAKA